MRNQIAAKISPYIIHNDHQASQYFKAIRTLVVERKESQDPEKRQQWQEAIEEVYDLIADEIITNLGQPTQAIQIVAPLVGAAPLAKIFFKIRGRGYSCHPGLVQGS